MRYENWKFVFCEQRVEGTLRIWAEPFVCLRVSKISTCAWTPMSAPTSPRTRITNIPAPTRAFLVVPTQAIVGQFIATFPRLPAAPAAVELQRRPDHGSDPVEAAGRLTIQPAPSRWRWPDKATIARPDVRNALSALPLDRATHRGHLLRRAAAGLRDLFHRLEKVATAFGIGVVREASSLPRYCNSPLALKPKKSGVH